MGVPLKGPGASGQGVYTGESRAQGPITLEEPAAKAKRRRFSVSLNLRSNERYERLLPLLF